LPAEDAEDAKLPSISELTKVFSWKLRETRVVGFEYGSITAGRKNPMRITKTVYGPYFGTIGHNVGRVIYLTKSPHINLAYTPGTNPEYGRSLPAPKTKRAEKSDVTWVNFGSGLLALQYWHEFHDDKGQQSDSYKIFFQDDNQTIWVEFSHPPKKPKEIFAFKLFISVGADLDKMLDVLEVALGSDPTKSSDGIQFLIGKGFAFEDK
jgi:hypothetical protein